MSEKYITNNIYFVIIVRKTLIKNNYIIEKTKQRNSNKWLELKLHQR